MRKDPKDRAEMPLDERLAALRRDLRILKWQTAALLALTGILLFQTFCGGS